MKYAGYVISNVRKNAISVSVYTDIDLARKACKKASETNKAIGHPVSMDPVRVVEFDDIDILDRNGTLLICKWNVVFEIDRASFIKGGILYETRNK